jgi:antitoxin (DNA-binding transcriptional repressor) of toxin-antitoxin stability system
MYLNGGSFMKNLVSVSNARKDLPKMIREIQRNPGTVFRIAVHSETIAELRAAKPMAPPGEAVRRLLRLRQGLSSAARGRKKVNVSKNLKAFLYTRGKE